MFLNIHKITICFFVSFFLIVNTGFLQGAEGDTDKFLISASKAWDQLKLKYQEGLKITVFYSAPGLIDAKREVCIKDKNEWSYYGYSDSERFIAARNASYSFRLNKADDHSQWTIAKLDQSENSNVANPQYTHGLLELSTLIFDPIMIEDQWLSSIFSSGKIDIQSVTDIPNEELVKIKFKCRNYKIDLYTNLLSGEVTFRKNHFYVIDNYKVTTEFIIHEVPGLKKRGKSGTIKAEVEKKFEYEIIDSVPYPRLSNTKYDVSPRVTEGVFNFPEDNFCRVRYKNEQYGNSIDNSIFYLTHYGFSEPSTPAKRSRWIRMVLVFVGLGLIGLGVYQKYKSQKL